MKHACINANHVCAAELTLTSTPIYGDGPVPGDRQQQGAVWGEGQLRDCQRVARQLSGSCPVADPPQPDGRLLRRLHPCGASVSPLHWQANMQTYDEA